MDRLPLELLRMIVKFVDNDRNATYRDDLKSLRLLSKSLFTELAAMPLFCTLPLCISSQSLANLSGIAEHPQLSKFVKEIVFSTMRVQRREDLIDRIETFRQDLEREATSLDALTLRQARYMAAYHSYVTSQEFLAKDQADEKIITRALRRFPNLVHLKITELNSSLGAQEILGNFGHVDGQVLSFDGDYTLLVLTKALSRAGVRLKYLGFGCIAGRDDRLHSKTDMPMDINEREHKVLPASEVIHGKPLSIEKGFDRGKIDQSRMMEQLWAIRMEIFVPKMQDAISTQRSSSVRKLLCDAPDLEQITLYHIPERGAEVPSLPFLSPPIPTFRALAVISASGFKCTTRSLTQFLRDHAATLVQVGLYNAQLTGNDDWYATVASIRTIHFCRLIAFRLSKNHDIKRNGPLTRYVMRMDNEHPLVDDKAKDSNKITYVGSASKAAE